MHQMFHSRLSDQNLQFPSGSGDFSKDPKSLNITNSCITESQVAFKESRYYELTGRDIAHALKIPLQGIITTSSERMELSLVRSLLNAYEYIKFQINPFIVRLQPK